MDPGAVPGGSTKILKRAKHVNGFWRGRNRIDMSNKDKVCIRLRHGRIRSNLINANDNAKTVAANDNVYVADSDKIAA